MADERPPSPQALAERARAMPDLAELCRIHDIGIELIERSHDLDELLDRVLEEYEQRLREIPDAALTADDAPDEARSKLRALVMFARQAAALKEKATAATALRRHAEVLEQVNVELQQTVAREELARRRVDDVLGVLDAGILVVAPDGRIRHANRAASQLNGLSIECLVGQAAAPFFGQVGRMSDGEVVRRLGSGETKVLLVARRDMTCEPGAEVVLLSDVTERDRERAEQHRLDRLSELLRTLAVLSHKINNPLTSLLGRAQILQMRKGTDAQVAKAAAVIEESAKRIASYIQELAHVVREGREEALMKLLEDPATAQERGHAR